jgi:vitamin B12 transporter
MEVKLNQLVVNYLFISWSVCTFTIAKASDAEVVTLPEIVISNDTADNFNSPASSSTVFNRAALDALNRADVNGVLQGLPGTINSQASASMPSNIILRGAAGGLGLVNLDGVPLFGNFTAFFPLSHYPLDLFNRVSVDRGNDQAQSSSRTLGGSINLTSRQLNDGQAFLHSEGGSYGTVRNNVGLGMQNKLGNWSFAGSQTNIFDGISQVSPSNGGNNESKNTQLSTGLLRWTKDYKALSLESSLYYVNNREGSDGPGLLANGKRGWALDPNGLLKQQTWVAQSQAFYHVSGYWDSFLQIGFTEDKQDGRVGTLANCCSMNLTTQLLLAHWQNTHKIALNSQKDRALSFIWGVDGQQQHGENLNNLSKVNSLTNSLLSPIARAEMRWGNWLTTAETRLDHYDQFGGDRVLFNVNNSWRFLPTMMAWTKMGTGYRTPAMNELLHPVFGSIKLAPESNFGGEVGWRWNPNNVYEISVSSYLQHYQNLIVLQQTAAGTIASANVSEAHIFGVETQNSFKWNSSWKSGFSYSYMLANNPLTGLKVNGRPENQGSVWTEWKVRAPITLRVDLTYREGYWSDPLNTIQVQAAPRVNASVNYQVTPKIKLTLRGENITDQRTPDLYGFNYPGAAIYGGAYFDW